MGLMRPADMAAEDSMKEAERRVTLWLQIRLRRQLRAGG